MNKTKTIKPDIARRFLKTYKDILLFIYEERRFEYDKDKPLELYVKSAHILNKNPEYFDTWIADVKDYDKEMLDVIRKIRYSLTGWSAIGFILVSILKMKSMQGLKY